MWGDYFFIGDCEIFGFLASDCVLKFICMGGKSLMSFVVVFLFIFFFLCFFFFFFNELSPDCSNSADYKYLKY